MGNGSSSEKKSKYKIRVLVLGIAATGKTAFAKQMKVLFCNGFSSEERSNYKNILVQNILKGFREYLELLKEKDIELGGGDKKVEKAIKYFSNVDVYATPLNKETVKLAKLLWKNEEFKNSFDSISEDFDLAIALRHCMKNISRISAPDFTPTDEDVLYSRQRTTGISETLFDYDKYSWNITDIGGHKSERRKWIAAKHSETEKIHAIIYFVGLDDYNVPLEDNPKKTRLEEALEVWEETINDLPTSGLYPVIIFFNKKDLFQSKIKKYPLNEKKQKICGKRYTGDNSDWEASAKFIRDIFLDKVNPDNTSGKLKRNDVYSHFTCALDTEDIGFVFGAAREYIFKMRLRSSQI